MGRAWIGAPLLMVGLGACGYWLGGPLGAGVAAVAGGLVPLLIERATRRQEALDSAQKTETAPWRGSRAKLLDPAQGVVPFIGRQHELKELHDWCLNPSASPVRLACGGGGIGKTRLALELGRRMTAQGGWRFVLVGEGHERDVVSAQRKAAASSKLLLVVDYAETRAGLDGMLEAVAHDRGWVRVLLLAREAGEWWKRLEAMQAAVRDLVMEARLTQLQLSDAVEPGAAAIDVVRYAAPFFADRLGLPKPDPGVINLVGNGPARMLDLHAAALVAVLWVERNPGGAALPVKLKEVLDELLGHEAHYWQGTAQRLGLLDGPQGLTTDQLPR